MNTQPTKTNGFGIPGAGIDAPHERRPGVPMEMDPPKPMGHAHWTEPERQPDPGHILRRKGLKRLTPVFGTAVPPRGISGLMRRAAYELPEHWTSHWMVLLMADRVDAFEEQLGKVLPFAVPALAAFAALSVRRRRARRSWFSRAF